MLTLGAAITGALPATVAHATDSGEVDEFDPAFFAAGGVTDTIIARFSQPDTVPDGTYATSIRVNGDLKEDGLVTFSRGDRQQAQPCLSDAMLAAYGVRMDALLPRAVDGVPANAPGDCAPLSERVTDATTAFNLRTQVLDLYVPNASMARVPRGTIARDALDPGITVGRLTYLTTSFMTRSAGGATTTHYAGLQAGVNVGQWRFRHAGAYRMADGETSYGSLSAHVERPLPAIASRMIIGDHHTGGEKLDSVAVQGISLTTDPRMLPDAASGYAPVVRGIAQTNALVRVKQRGVTLSETAVAPGAFVIDDLNPTGYGGDLDIAIVESDGQVRTFTVPYSSTPELLREGQHRYAVTAGRFADVRARYRPRFSEASLARGLTDVLTAYTAGAVAQDYRSFQLGVARNTRFGAVSLDMTGARTRLDPSRASTGYQLQSRYSRNFATRGATLAIGAYRYSTDGYLGMADAFHAMEALYQTGHTRERRRLRGRLDVTLNKTLGRFGSANLAGSTFRYADDGHTSTSMTAGYSTALGMATVSVNAMRSRVYSTDPRTPKSSFQLSISAPLGVAPRAPAASFSTEHQPEGASSQRVALQGSLHDESPVNYSASVTRGRTRDIQYSAGVQHTTGIAGLQAGMFRSRDFQSTSLGASGGVVAHGGGLTFAPALGETLAVVSAHGASGARVGHGATHIGSSGFAVVPHLMPYRMNTVTIDPAGSSMDVQFGNTSSLTAPTAGAAVRVAFDSRVARALLIETPEVEGRHLSFGAEVLDMEGRSIGLVGQSGRIFINDDARLGELIIKWDDTKGVQCTIVHPDGSDAGSTRVARPYAMVRATCSALSPSSPLPPLIQDQREPAVSVEDAMPPCPVEITQCVSTALTSGAGA